MTLGSRGSGTIIGTVDGGTTWTTQVTLSPNQYLASVSCVTAGAGPLCVAVGATNLDQSTAAPVVVTNASGAWTAGGGSFGTMSMLEGVTCPTATECLAVGAGTGGDAVVVQSTDGGLTWSVNYTLAGANNGSSSASPDLYNLDNVTCGTTLFCVAAGSAGTLSLTNPSAPLLLETTDGGTTWTSTVLPAVEPAGSGYATVTDSSYGVACLPIVAIVQLASSCQMSGWYTGYSAAGTPVSSGGYILGDASGSWTVEYLSTPQPPGELGPVSGITCPTTTTCWAGSPQGGFLTTTDGGTTWSAVSPPLGFAGIPDAIPIWVSCPVNQVTSCWAVGTATFSPALGAAMALATSSTGSGSGTALSFQHATSGGALHFYPSANGYSFSNSQGYVPSASEMEKYFPASVGMTYPIFGGLTPMGSAFQNLLDQTLKGGLCYGFATTATANYNDWKPSVPLYSTFSGYGSSASFPPFTTEAPQTSTIKKVLEAYSARQLSNGTFQGTNDAWLAAGVIGNTGELQDIAATVATRPEMVLLVPSPSLMVSNPGLFQYLLFKYSHAVVAYAANPTLGTISVYDPNDPYTASGWDGPTVIQVKDDGASLYDRGTSIGIGGDGGPASDWTIVPVPDNLYDGSPGSQAWPMNSLSQVLWSTAQSLTLSFVGGNPLILVGNGSSALATSLPATSSATGVARISGPGTAADISSASTASFTTIAGAAGTLSVTYGTNASSIALSHASQPEPVSLSVGGTTSTTTGRTFSLTGLTLNPGESVSLAPSLLTGSLTLDATLNVARTVTLTIADTGSSNGTVTAALTLPAGTSETTVYVDGAVATAPIYAVTTTATKTVVTLLAGTPGEISSSIANDLTSIQSELASLPAGVVSPQTTAHLHNAIRLAGAASSHVAAEEQILLLLAEVDSNSGIPADITAAIDASGQDAGYLLLAEYG